ncbi:GAF domain-containing sensor histidine kinase [Arthrobacter mangrovi]|uniref:GAF domain-containing sensor histidine kinase n=1 Tax=Arthrobacter mangrovi TaxID=2966350 RepID=UPI00222F3B09|nr:histidine kinase [Arthrobacter mangrovi]
MTDRTDGLIDARARIAGLLDSAADGAEELSLRAILQRLVRVACRRTGAGYGLLDFGAANGRDTGRFIAAAGGAAAGSGVLRPEDLVASWDNTASGQAAGGAGILRLPVRTRRALYAYLYLADLHPEAGIGSQAEESAGDLAGLAGAAIDSAWRRRHWLASIMELPRRLPREGDVLRLITEQALNAGHAELVLAAAPTSGGGLRCRAAAGTNRELYVGRDLPAADRPADSFPATDRPILGTSVHWLGPAHPASARCALVPLHLPGEPPGLLLLFRSPGAEDFSPVDLDMAAAFSEQAALTVELARAERLREAHALSAERDRLAGELNDLVIQRLFAAGLGLQSLRRFANEDEARQRISALTSEIDHAITELRAAIYALAPEPADAEPLSRQILRTISDTPPASGLRTTVDLSGDLDAASASPAADHLLSVLRHALAHAAKTGDIADLRVSAALQDRLLRLGLETNGPAIGLTALAAQTGAARHTLHMTKTADNTTRLEWAIPWTPDAAEDPLRD